MKRRIPAVSGWAGFALAGNLMTYGPNLDESVRSIASQIDKILRGARPADLPVPQPTKVELVLNMRTARTFAIAFPRFCCRRADQVIE